MKRDYIAGLIITLGVNIITPYPIGLGQDIDNKRQTQQSTSNQNNSNIRSESETDKPLEHKILDIDMEDEEIRTGLGYKDEDFGKFNRANKSKERAELELDFYKRRGIDLREQIQKDGTVIFFTSPTCGWCGPFNKNVVERFNREYPHREKITLIRFHDTFLMPGIYRELCGGGGLPKMVVFKGGRPYFRIGKYVKEQIEEDLKEFSIKVDETLKN